MESTEAPHQYCVGNVENRELSITCRTPNVNYLSDTTICVCHKKKKTITLIQGKVNGLTGTEWEKLKERKPQGLKKVGIKEFLEASGI